MLLHLAATYPSSSFVGYDTSVRALAVARQHAADRGLSNVTFLNPDDGPQGRLPGTPTYHLVMAQEAIHDTAHPQVGLRLAASGCLGVPCAGTGTCAVVLWLQSVTLLVGAQGSSMKLLASDHLMQHVSPCHMPHSPSKMIQSTCCCHAVPPSLQDILQAIHQSLLPDSTPTQQPQQPAELADALDGYSGGPAFVLTEVRSEPNAADNVAGPAGPLVYGLSVSVCLSSGLAGEGGAGLGTVGMNEVRGSMA